MNEMSTITITLPDEQLAELKRLATDFQVPPEELARIGIEQLLARPDAAFNRAVEHVLAKNAELYQRLA
jgi:predicted transcriptional regulator